MMKDSGHRDDYKTGNLALRVLSVEGVLGQ